MSPFSERGESGPPRPVPPLTVPSKTDGKPYVRSAAILAEIARMLFLPHSAWITEAADLLNETLVFLIRLSRRADPEVYGQLFQQLSTRITRLARRWVRGLGRAGQEIVLKVEIVERVLAEKPTLQTEYLEVAFAKAVESLTVAAVRRHRLSPFGGRRGEILPGATDEDGDEIERPLELAPDDRPGPEEVLLDLWDRESRDQVIDDAKNAVKDPRDLEAVLMHHCDGVPIVSKDPAKSDLVHHFQESEGQIKHRLARGLRAMRRRLGVKR